MVSLPRGHVLIMKAVKRAYRQGVIDPNGVTELSDLCRGKMTCDRGWTAAPSSKGVFENVPVKINGSFSTGFRISMNKDDRAETTELRTRLLGIADHFLSNLVLNGYNS